MELSMNSPIVRFTIFCLILASGLMGWLVNEFFYFGEDFLAGVTVVCIPAFAFIGARFLRDDPNPRLNRVRRRASTIQSAW